MAIRTNFDNNAIRAGLNKREELDNKADSFSTRNTVAEQGANKSLDDPGPGKTRFAADRAFREIIFNNPPEARAQEAWMEAFSNGGSDSGFKWKENYDMAMGFAPSGSIDKGKSNTMSSEPKSADEEGTA